MLKEVVLPDTTPQFQSASGEKASPNFAEDCKFYVSSESVRSAYYNSNDWSKYPKQNFVVLS